MIPKHTPTAFHLSDLRGAAALTADAVSGVTSVVEAMHAGIARLPGVRRGHDNAPPPARTSGLTGLVYQSIRGVTRVVGKGTEAVLGQVEGIVEGMAGATARHAPWHPRRSAVISALNGVFGDHLAATANPLALSMEFRAEGRSLPLNREALAAALPDAGPKLLVLIHGLCMNDFQWSRAGHHHGEHLAHALGYTPVHLHYNTGLHISANGRLMADAMQRLLEAWPVPLERVTLLGHSMGGLVARSALHYATAAGNTSLGGESPRIDDLICLGTPHLGAPLEKAGHGVDTFLEALPFAAPLARIGRARSAGITDLREGHLIDPQVQAQGEAQARGRNMEAPAAIPLPKGTRCYAVAASLGPRSGRRSPRWLADGLGDGLGDGLVPVASALGQHADAARCLNFPSHRQHVVYGTGHLDLLSSAEVAAQLERWLR